MKKVMLKDNENNELLSEIITTGEITKSGRVIDGKVEYVKRLDLGALPNNNFKYIAHGLDMSTITITKYCGIAKVGNNYVNLNYYNPRSASSSVGFYIENVNVVIATAVNFSSYTGKGEIYFTYNN